jgi:hypothetical protein
LRIYYFQGFFHQLLNVLAVMLEAYLALRIIHFIRFLEKDLSCRNRIWTVDVQVKICNNVKVIPNTLRILGLIFDGGRKLFDQFNQRVGHFGALIFIRFVPDVFYKLLHIATVFF